MGYNVKDGGAVEKQDDYLKRMGGIERLYAAIIITPPPPGVHNSHPHGLEFAWRWLARLADQRPHLDTTATALFNLLDVAGNAMYAAYRVQFHKILIYLHDTYLPQVKTITLPECMGPVLRLENFLKQAIKTRHIDCPPGLLSRNFWNS